jgi:predicted dehydrogenase/putative sterol carrier protein
LSKINVGIVGCGRISDLHVPGYQNHPDATLYAVCDTRTEVAHRKKEEWRATRVFTDYREMLQDPQLDAVEILTPQPLHEPMVLAAARAGKHIALQKPMTIDLASADRMLQAVQASGIVFKVTDNYLFYPPLVLARKMIADGTIGTPSNLRIKLISGSSGGWEVPPSAWQWRMAEKEAGRGMQTFDHGHHLWAVAWYLMGPVERVVGWIDSADGIIDSPATIMWKHRKGMQYGMCEYAHASEMSIPSRYYANDEWFEITGSRGIIVVHRCTGNVVEGPAVSLFTGDRWQHYGDIPSDWSEGFKNATANFIAAVKGEESPLLSGSQGRDILKFALAIAKSSRVRREVFLDEMDARLPAWFAWRQARKSRREHSNAPGLLEKLGLGGRDERYASQALDLTEKLMERFKPEAVQDWNAAIGLQLLPHGTAPQVDFSFIIQAGHLVITRGHLPVDPSLVLRIRAGTWAAVLLGKKRIETAFLQGKLKLEGQAEQALKLRAAFGI